MKRFWLTLSLFLLAIPLVVTAQQNCGNGLPCGPLPWPLPKLPILVSPTPMPTLAITAGPTPTPLSTDVTGDVFPTIAPVGGIVDLGAQFETLAAVINATDVPVIVSGTPVSSGDQLQQAAEDAGVFFGYVHGFSEVNVGGLTPIILFVLTTFVTVIVVKSASFILPFAIAIFNFVLRVLTFIVNLVKP